MEEKILGVGDLGDGNVFQLITTNPKLDYHIVGMPNKDNAQTITNEPNDYIDKDMVDYNFPVPDATLKKWVEINKARGLGQEEDIEKYKKAGLPLSFLEISNVEEGTDWYLNHRPDLPDGLAPLFSRYMWGDLKKYSRQQLKLLRKKRDKDLTKKKKDPSFKIEQGSYTISFV
tara:strand:+ start:2065 stop:2583 length:519 start_codon:yes stop_codon:yes gene_type:complete